MGSVGRIAQLPFFTIKYKYIMEGWKETMKHIARTVMYRWQDGSVTVLFQNMVTMAQHTQTYKNKSAAKCAVTKFEKRMARIYG